MKNYNKRLVEVDEILKYLSNKDLSKIPKELRDAIKENKDKNYIWNYDTTKSLKEQNLNRDTIALLSYLNMKYLLNEKQRAFMKKVHELNEQKLEEEKLQRYNPNNIFENRKQNIKVEETNIEEQVSMIEYKESIFKKIINKIKSIFHIN